MAARNQKPIEAMDTKLLDDFPPCLCRLLARHPKGKPLTAEEIAGAAGWDQHSGEDTPNITPMEVEEISQKTSWGDVQYQKILNFLRGCNLDFDNPNTVRRVDSYLRKKCHFNYLLKHTEWKTRYCPLLIRWVEWEIKRKSWGDNPRSSVRKLVDRLAPGIAARNAAKAARTSPVPPPIDA